MFFYPSEIRYSALKLVEISCAQKAARNVAAMKIRKFVEKCFEQKKAEKLKDLENC